MGTNLCSEAYYIYLSGSGKPIILLRIISGHQQKIFIQLSFVRLKGWSPPSGIRMYLQFVELNPRNPAYGLMFWIQRVNSKLLTLLNFFYA
jgi:hypothetical protein